jgi:hypothetical protein
MKIDQKLEIDKLLELPVEDRPRRIAELVHRIQVDKAKKPYIDHPRRVAENLQYAPAFEGLPKQDKADLVAAAWLHDVVEDSGDEAWPKVEVADLLAWGINERVVELVDLLTRKKEVPDDTYYKKIKANPLARLVKIADVTDNSNMQRILWVEDAGVARNATKYVHAFEVFELSDDEKTAFKYRINAPAELGTITDERLLKFGARGDGPGQYFSLYCMDGALGQWRFDARKGGWVPTFRMFDFMIKGEFDFDIIPVEMAKQEFPQAFPMLQLEGDPND